MAKYTEVDKRLSGSFGTLQVNGYDWADITAVKATVTAEYEDVAMGDEVGKKLIRKTGEGTISMSRAYSRTADFIESLNSGRPPVLRLLATVQDPDADGGQVERVAIDGVKLSSFDVINFTHGEVVKDELPFLFQPSKVHYLDRIVEG